MFILQYSRVEHDGREDTLSQIASAFENLKGIGRLIGDSADDATPVQCGSASDRSRIERLRGQVDVVKVY